MLRAIVVSMMTIFAVGVLFLVGGPVIEEFGQKVESSGSDTAIGQDGIVQSYYDAIFKGVPLVFISGMLMWGLIYTIRKERGVFRR